MNIINGIAPHRSFPAWGLVCLALLLCSGFAHAAETGAVPDARTWESLGLPADADLLDELVTVYEAEQPHPERDADDAPLILAFRAVHAGENRLLLEITYDRTPDFARDVLVFYANLDNDMETGRADPHHGGVDVMTIINRNQKHHSFFNEMYNTGNTASRVAVAENRVYIVLDAPLAGEEAHIPVRLHLLSQREGGSGSSTPPQEVRLARHDRELPPLPEETGLELMPASAFHYIGEAVAYESLSNKGLTYEQVAPEDPIEFGRPRPDALFADESRQPGKVGSIDRQQVPLELEEEAGVDRSAAAVTTGFPLPRGGVYDLNRLRLLSPEGREIHAQFTATAFWPDDSLKWVLIDFTTPLEANEVRELTVEFGSEVQRQNHTSPLHIDEDNRTLTVNTGPLEVEIDKKRFNLFRNVQDASGGGRQFRSIAGGIELVDEHGNTFTTAALAPEQVVIEQQGPEKVVVRVEGRYGNAEGETYMRYITRLTFRADSSRVTVAHTHVNDYLETEFTDITSLTTTLRPVEELEQATAFVPGENGEWAAHTEQALSLFQLNDQASTITAKDESIPSGRATGVIEGALPDGTMQVAVHKFWERWPKELAADTEGIVVGLLPAQPGTDYGSDLPYYLRYPFVEGRYRFKWGMSFTERVTFDFKASSSPRELHAEANLPIVAVLPAAWYAETEALADFAPPIEDQFNQWDQFIARSFEAHMTRKKRQREYGYFNYGDWFGERGRNWGNNEYDLPHGLFMQFVRTGNRDYYRLALAGARHQADVDIVHAYPDPYYVGGNQSHAVGHTGTVSHRSRYATWSYPYDTTTHAANGHTWTGGMMDAWYLAGDARVMTATLELGEHIAWAMSRRFDKLGSHERTAGWSLLAIMNIYNGTYDPVYLEAAERIVAVPLREQQFDRGGAWPHILPGGHAGGVSDAYGNNLFLIGVLLSGMQAYHEHTEDPDVAKSLISGARWVSRSWNPSAGAWPYSASVSGEPYSKPTLSMSPLVISPLAYVGHLTGEERFIEIARQALSTYVVFGSADVFGKDLGKTTILTHETLASLQQWYLEHDPAAGRAILSEQDSVLQDRLRETEPAERHAVRAPDRKVFHVELREAKAELTATRSPHGGLSRRDEFGTIRVMDQTGAVVDEGQFSTDTSHEFRSTLEGKPGDQFRVVVEDDQRSVWNLTSDHGRVVMETVPGFRMGGINRARYYFHVPEGTQAFRLHLTGVHSGGYGAAVLTSEGELVEHFSGVNTGQAVVASDQIAQAKEKGFYPEHTLVVQPADEETGTVWSVVLWAAGDVGCKLEGVPPYLSLTPDAWFEPVTGTSGDEDE